MSNNETTFAAFPQALQDKIAQNVETQQSQPGQQTPGMKRRLTGMVTPVTIASPRSSVMGNPQTRPQASYAPIPVKDPGFTNPSADPEGISITLPSNFYFLDFKDVYV